MFNCPVSFTEKEQIIPLLSLDSTRHSTPLIKSNFKELAKMEEEFDKRYTNFLDDSLLKNSSPLMQEFLQSKKVNKNNSTRHSTPLFKSNFKERAKMEEEFDKMYTNFLGDSLLKNSSPLMQEFLQSKKVKESLPKLADGSSAMEAGKLSGKQIIRTNVGDMKPESISVKVDVTKSDPVSGRPICTLTISGEENSDQGFSKFKSTRTLPSYIIENKMEEQIISQLVKDKLTGNRVLEITLPEEPRKAVEDSLEGGNFKSEEIKIQIKNDKNDKNDQNDKTCGTRATTEALNPGSNGTASTEETDTVIIETCDEIDCS